MRLNTGPLIILTGWKLRMGTIMLRNGMVDHSKEYMMEKKSDLELRQMKGEMLARAKIV